MARFSFRLFSILIIGVFPFISTVSAQEVTSPLPKVDKKALRAELNKHLKQASFYYKVKQYDLAIGEWGRALSLDPENKRIPRLIDRAKKKVLKSNTDKHLKQARAYYKKKEYDQAIYEWELALSLDPGNRKIPRSINRAKKILERRAKRSREKAPIKMAAPIEGSARTLSLEDCINIAVENKRSLQIAKRQFKLAEMRIWEARRGFLGKISAKWDEYEGHIKDQLYDGRRFLIEGQQPIYRGGEPWYVLKQAKANLEVAKNDYERLKNDLILEVKKDYYSLGKSMENLDMQIELEEEVRRISEMVDKALEAGSISKLDQLNVKSQHVQVKFQVASSKQDVATAKLVLKQAMNISTDERIAIDGRFEFKLIDVDLDKCWMLARLNRPEMMINKFMLDYYIYEAEVAKSKMRLNINLLGSYGQAGEWFVHERKTPRMGPQWYAALKVKVPIRANTVEYSATKEEWPPVVSAYQGTDAITHTAKFYLLDKVKNISEIEEAEIEIDRAKNELEKTEKEIYFELKEAFQSYERAILQFETSREKVSYQEQDLELTKIKRGFDEVQDSVVIESMIKLTQERYASVQSISDYYIAISSLNKAIGISDYFKINPGLEPEEK